MQSKVIRTSKRPVAVGTFERFNASVFAIVARQFIGSSKLPVAPFPGALVRLFTGVSSLVCLEVGTLGVNLVAAWVLASVDPLVPWWRLCVIVHSIHEFKGVVRGYRHPLSREGMWCGDHGRWWVAEGVLGGHHG